MPEPLLPHHEFEHFATFLQRELDVGEDEIEGAMGGGEQVDDFLGRFDRSHLVGTFVKQRKGGRGLQITEKNMELATIHRRKSLEELQKKLGYGGFGDGGNACSAFF